MDGELEEQLGDLQAQLAQAREVAASHGPEHRPEGFDPIPGYHQYKDTTGAPTHEAPEGTRCWVGPDNEAYINNDGSTGWTLLNNLAAFEVPITNADSADSTKPRIVLACPFAGEILKVELETNQDEVCGATSLIVDIHKITDPANDGVGTTMYTTQGNRPTMTNTNRYEDATLPDVLTFAQGNRLAFYIDQPGTGVTTVTISVWCKKT